MRLLEDLEFGGAFELAEDGLLLEQDVGFVPILERMTEDLGVGSQRLRGDLVNLLLPLHWLRLGQERRQVEIIESVILLQSTRRTRSWAKIW